jgi:3-hexulose-6-phosphate synthase
MLLQFANDLVEKSGFLAATRKVSSLIDILEIGTPAIIANGIELVAEARRFFPQQTLLADIKIVDAGYLEAELAFERGADIVTVLGCASDETINQAIRAARVFDGRVMLDTIGTDNLKSIMNRAAAICPDYVCLHTPSDKSRVGETDFVQLVRRDMAVIRENLPETRIAVAGGISPESLELLLPLKPDVVIVGRFIYESEAPREAASRIRKAMVSV